jgi:hypothetical protein
MPLPELSKGTHHITVYQQIMYPEYLHGMVYRYSKVTVHFTVNDNQPPTIVVSSIANKSYYNQDTFDLNFTVDIPTSWTGYSLDDNTNVTVTENTTIADLSEGPHSIRMYANDTVGNMGVSQPIVFSIGFFPTLPVIIGSIVTVLIASIALVVFFKKRKR